MYNSAIMAHLQHLRYLVQVTALQYHRCKWFSDNMTSLALCAKTKMDDFWFT